MIQRIQTIFLLLAAGALGSLFALPFFSVASDSGYASAGIFGDQEFNLQDNLGLLIVFLLSAALALISIFLFKHRKTQKRLALFAAILGFGGIGFAAFLLYQAGAFSMGGLQVKAGIALPVVAILFQILAYRAINKDEKIIKSSYSRLR